MTIYQVVRLAWFQQLEIAQKEQERAEKNPNPATKARATKEAKRLNELYELLGKYENSDEMMK